MGKIRATTSVLVRQGARYVLAVRPLEWYAGSVGVGATVEEVCETAVYVLFDGGLRESYPPARFAEYFRPESNSGVPNDIGAGSDSARTVSGNILRH